MGRSATDLGVGRAETSGGGGCSWDSVPVVPPIGLLELSAECHQPQRREGLIRFPTSGNRIGLKCTKSLCALDLFGSRSFYTAFGRGFISILFLFMPLMILSRNPGTESEMWSKQLSPKGLFGSRKKWELGNLGTESGFRSGFRRTQYRRERGFRPRLAPRRPFFRRDYQAHTQTGRLCEVHTESSPAPPDFQPSRDCASLSQARKFVPAIDCIGSRRPLTAMGCGRFSFRAPLSMLVRSAPD